MLDAMKRKSKSDKADGTLVTALVAIPMIIITMGLGADLNRTMAMKREHMNTAQEAANMAITRVGVDGAVTKESVGAGGSGDNVMNWYLNGQSDTMEVMREGCTEVKDPTKTNEVMIQVPRMNVRVSGMRGNYGDIGRSGIATFTPDAKAAVNGIGNFKGRVVEIEIIDSSRNNFSWIPGIPACSTTHNTVSAVVFGSNGDVN